MDTTSYWIDSITLPRFPSLARDLKVDVAVIGGGICGVTAAYLLKKAGKTVALIERGRCAQVDTGHTTAHLTCVTDERLRDLSKYFGRERAKAVWDAGLAAIDQIHSIVKSERIDCEFTWIPAYLHTSIKEKPDKEKRALKVEAKLAVELGFHASYIESVPGLQRPGVHFRNQAKFHPLKYLRGILPGIPGEGSHVFENSEVESVEDKPLTLKIGKRKITCDSLVLATHTPLMGKTNLFSATLFQTKLVLYTTYALGAKIPSGQLPEASFWDTSEPYYYLRVDRGPRADYAIFGGEDHKTGQVRDTEGCFRRLEKRLRALIPKAVVDYRWSGQVVETNDGLPFIGETAKNQFVATGFAGNGMTFGTLGAMMAKDSITGGKNPWSKLFAPDRKKVRGGLWRYLVENKDYPYYLVRDRFAGGERQSIASLSKGRGKILKIGGKKIAVYKDPSGKVIRKSPVCTHMGCIVHWNEAESTWDCPCHGSRFRPTGEVLAGPAEEPLSPG